MTRSWWTLIGACSGLFILMLDSTVVALALSSIRVDVGADATQLQWVMNGYLLTIAVLVVTAGRLVTCSAASVSSRSAWCSLPPARCSPGRRRARRC